MPPLVQNAMVEESMTHNSIDIDTVRDDRTTLVGEQLASKRTSDNGSIIIGQIERYSDGYYHLSSGLHLHAVDVIDWLENGQWIVSGDDQ